MSKKLYLPLIVLLVLAVGAICYANFYRGQQPALNEESGAERRSAVSPVTAVPATETVGNEELRSLAAGTPFFLQLLPRGIDVLFGKYARAKQAVVNTLLWQKLGLQQELTEKFKEGFQQQLKENPAAEHPFTYEDFQNVSEQAAAYWNSLSELTLVGGTQSFEVPTEKGTIRLPALLLHAEFSDAAQAQSALKNLGDKILDTRTSRETPVMKAELSSAGDRIDFIFRNQTGTFQLPAAVFLRQADLFFVLGEKDDAVFYSAEPDKQLASTAKWQTVRDVRPANPAMLAFVDPPAISAIFEGLLANLPVTDKNQAAAREEGHETLSMFRQMSSFAGTADAAEPETFRICAAPLSGSGVEALYQQAIALRKGVSNSSSGFARLLDDQTIFALRFSLLTLPTSLHSTAEQLQAAMKSSSAESKEQFDRLVEKAGEVVKRLSFSEAGIFVAPPLMPPIIGAGIYFGGSTLSGTDLLQQFSDSLNELATLIDSFSSAAPGRKAPVLSKIVKRTDGSTELELSVAGLKLVGGLTDEHSLAISIDSSIVGDLAKKAKTGISYFSKFSGPSELTEDLDHSDYFFYLNTGEIVDLARTFTPLLLAQQPSGQKVERGDIEEVLNLLRISYLGYQTEYFPGGATVCTESKSNILQKK
jgi:hypothetical protein